MDINNKIKDMASKKDLSDKLDRIFDLMKENFDAHIETKATNSQFHEKSYRFYDFLFRVYHEIKEKCADNGRYDNVDSKDLIKRSISNLEEVKNILEDLIEEKNTVGEDNRFRTLVDQIEGVIGDAKAFDKDKKESYESEEDEKDEYKSSRAISKLRDILKKKI